MVRSPYPRTGRRFREQVRACLARVTEHPLGYQAVYRNIRRATLRGFPYSIFYLPVDSAIIVFACFHTARDPAAWERRLPPTGEDEGS